jgi:HK97 family phage prohead protease
MPIIHKNNSSEFDAGLNCVLSDMTVDSYGDVIGDADHPTLGWDTRDFAKNPIALWSHDSKSPIGTWQDVHVSGGALRGRLQLAPHGTTPLVNELRALMAAHVLRGISVGFIPLESKPRGNTGWHYTRQKLCEASLCSIPANPSALLTAKALGVSKKTIAMVFKQDGQDDFENVEDCVVEMLDDGMDPDEAIYFCSDLFSKGRHLDPKVALAQRSSEIRRRAMATIKKVSDRLAREYEASWAGQMQQQHDETIAAWTRAQQRLAPQDPPPFVPSGRGASEHPWNKQKRLQREEAEARSARWNAQLPQDPPKR